MMIGAGLRTFISSSFCCVFEFAGYSSSAAGGYFIYYHNMGCVSDRVCSFSKQTAYAHGAGFSCFVSFGDESLAYLHFPIGS